MRRRALSIGAACVAAAIAVAAGLAHGDGDAGAPSARIERAAPVRLELEVGQERSFAVHIDSHVKIAGSAAAPGAAGQEMDLALDGVLSLTVVSAHGGDATVLARMPEARLSFSQGGTPSPAAGLAPTVAGLGSGLAIAYGADGVLRGFRDDLQLDRFADQLLRQAVSSLQTGLPASGQSGAWEKDERDGTGTYRASYRRASKEDGALSFDKNKTGYTVMASAATGGGAPRVLGKARGHFESRVGIADGWPMVVTGEERIDVAVGAAGSLTSTATTHVRFVLNGRRLVDPDALAGLTARRSSRPSAAAGEDDARIAQDRIRLGTTTLAEVRDAYANLDKVDPKRRANAERALFDKTAAHVRVNGNGLEELLGSLRGRNATDPWLQNALGALAYVGCPKCQTALVEQVMARRHDQDFSSTLVPLLAEPKVPSAEGEQALRKLETSGDISTRSVAQLALGTVANKVALTDEPRADRLVGGYIDQFRDARTTEAKLSALAILGNTGSKRLPAEVDALTRDPSEDVRAAAVQALRLCPTDVAMSTLERMLADESPRVRAAVVDALGQQTPNALAAELLSARLGIDPASGVRSAIVRVLQGYYATSLAAKAAIDRTAESDPDPSVRTLAKNTRIMFAMR